MPYVEYDEVEAICSDCGRIFRSEEALSAHREEAHAGLEASPRPARPVAAAVGVRCPVCGRGFDSATTLRAHRARAHAR
ncbi:MAG TPA: C2H2-type zinc finger protein [Thermoplasmata archaeon]|nr:C2H2-type zinc finger protein [Thermoplasmata archaeon]